jgi:hypothetical protein
MYSDKLRRLLKFSCKQYFLLLKRFSLTNPEVDYKLTNSSFIVLNLILFVKSKKSKVKGEKVSRKANIKSELADTTIE